VLLARNDIDRPTVRKERPYPPIGDYAYLSDCHSSALVSKDASIDWCCMPRIDSSSIFGRLLDWKRGGYCRIRPEVRYVTRRRYLPGALVLETTFTTEDAEARVIDCFTIREGGSREPHQQLLRVVEGVKGRVTMAAEIVPRFDYGATLPWIKKKGAHFLALGGSSGLLAAADFRLAPRGRHELAACFTVGAGERYRLSILFRRPERLDGGLVDAVDPIELDRRLEATLSWWKAWTAKGRFSGPYAELVARSAVVLKGLSNAPTGAIAAAATTSLPEVPGGSRNWDYRFTWIRDSVFTVRSLAELGYRSEADGFRRFIERSAAGSSGELQVLFGVGGERRLPEYEIAELAGYGGARPVRVGNGAATQLQLDMYGELIDLAWRWHRGGHSPDDDYWTFLVEIVKGACRSWPEPDKGIWEMRGKPRHFVLSKAMCWSAVEKGIALAKELGRRAPVAAWERERDRIRHAVEERGYDPRRGIFVQAFGTTEMDASLLLLPATGFVEYGDARMVRTTDAIAEELSEDGLLRRYAAGGDKLGGREGTFLACSFWLAECLARQGRSAEAHRVFSRALETGNDLGLFSEEFDATTGLLLGNFPQGLSHLSLIAAAVALEDPGGRAPRTGRLSRRTGARKVGEPAGKA
jgi:GH15 family glucan-1,4-alpha-glucosidase